MSNVTTHPLSAEQRRVLDAWPVGRSLTRATLRAYGVHHKTLEGLHRRGAIVPDGRRWKRVGEPMPALSPAMQDALDGWPIGAVRAVGRVTLATMRALERRGLVQRRARRRWARVR